MNPRHSPRSRGRFNFLFYLVATVIVAVAFSRAAPRLSALLNHFGSRTPSSGPRINLVDSGALRGIQPLRAHTAASHSHSRSDHNQPQSDKVSFFVATASPAQPFLLFPPPTFPPSGDLVRPRAVVGALTHSTLSRWPTKKSSRLRSWLFSAQPS